MDAAVAALLGAAIGTFGSIGGMWLQQRHQNRRERLKIASDLGLADYKGAMDLAHKLPGARVPPLATWVAYHAEFLDALANGTLDVHAIERLEKRHEELIRALPNAPKGKNS